MMLARMIKDDTDRSKMIMIISMRVSKDVKNMKNITFDDDVFINDVKNELFQILVNSNPDRDDFKLFDTEEEWRPQRVELDPNLDYGDDVVKKALLRFADCYSFNLKELSKRGWFLDGPIEQRMPEIYEEKFDENTLSFLEEVLPDYYRNNFDGIIEELCERYPNRKDFIKNEIVKGYNDGKGTIRLAILGVISQIDGICWDALNKLFFIKHQIEKNKYAPKITGILPNNGSDLLAINLDAIIEDSPVYTHYSNLDRFSSKFNRHTAVHGMDLDYGEETNFWKILSLLRFVSDALHFFDDNKFETRNILINSGI